MYYSDICRVLGRFFYAFAALMLIPFGLAVYYDYYIKDVHPTCTYAFLWTIVLTVLVGLILSFFGRKSEKNFRLFRRESLLTMVLVWLLAPLVSMLPFVFSSTLESPFLAYFETVSALTTTGSSVMCPKKYEGSKEIAYVDKDYGDLGAYYTYKGTIEPIRNAENKIIVEGIEAVAKPILFWRGFLSWIGGLGIIVIFSAVLPVLGMGGKIFLFAEMTGPVKEGFTPRIIETTRQLWKIYLFISAAQLVLLLVTNPLLSFFDAVCITFSTVSTGGLSVKNHSIASYANASTEWVVILFMFLGSVNFNLFYFLIRGKIYRLYNPELLVFLVIILVSGFFTAWQLYGLDRVSLDGGIQGSYTGAEALRYGFFQIISAQSSCGFATANYDQWPYVVQALMLILIFIGGMSGSTSGGMKVIRPMMLFRVVCNKIELLFRPATIRQLRIGKEEFGLESAQMVFCFFAAYIAISVAAVFLFTLDHVDPETALGLVSATINNSGLGFRQAGPTLSCAFLSPFGAMLGSFLMLLGRLELFAILVILVPAFWKQTE